MTARGDRLLGIFCDALERPAPEREAFVATACAGDGEMQAEILGLLRVHRDHIRTERMPPDPAGGRVRTTGPAGRYGAPPAPPAPRTLLAGRYLIGDPIGAGGAGAVVGATDVLTGAEVAVKFVAARTEAEERAFLREAAALRRARAPGVVWFITEVREAVTACLVMTRVRGDPFPGAGVEPGDWETIGPRACEFLDALQSIHDAGVLHRDIKPSNVLVGPDGTVTIVDLGLAQDCTDGACTRSAGPLIGSMGYVAPERTDGSPATVAADLWAAGVVLAEALGARPAGPPGPSGAGPGLAFPDSVPLHVRETVMRLRAADPCRRPSSARAARRALRVRDGPAGRRLPHLGPAGLAEAVVEAVRRGVPIDVTGPPGTGRTRVLRAARRGLRRLGLRVAVLPPAGARAVAGAAARARAVDVATVAHGADVLVSDDHDLRASDVRAAVDALRAARAQSGGAACPSPGPVVIRVTARPGRPFVRTRRLRIADIRPLIVAPDRIFRGRERAAAALRAASGGLPARLAEEIRRWCSSGVAHREGRHLRVDPAALERAGGIPVALRDAGFERLLDASRRRLDAGRVPESFECACQAAVVARTGGQHARRYGEALALVTRGALALATPAAIDVALYHAELTPVTDDDVVSGWRDVLEAADAWVRNDFPRSVELARLAALTGTSEQARAAWPVAVAASRRCAEDVRRTVHRDAAAWVRETGSREARALLSAWVAWLRYYGGQFDRAALLHARAARLAGNPKLRVTFLCNAAMAALESGRHATAASLAAELVEAAGSVPDTVNAARAEWIARQAVYRLDGSGPAAPPGPRAVRGVSVARAPSARRRRRAGRELPPRGGVDEELLDAASKLPPVPVRATLELGEAAFAWRAGDATRAAAIARRAAATARACGDCAVGGLAAGLAAMCGGAAEAADLEAIAAACARTSTPPGVRAQVAALAVAAGAAAGLPPGLVYDAAKWASAAPRRAGRREVLTPDEITAWLGASGPGGA